MTTSPALDLILSVKDYRQITINTFQGYIDKDINGKYPQKAIKIDFKLWIKENQGAINISTQMIIKQYCILRSIWINHYENRSRQSKILIKKLVLAIKYDIDLNNQDINHIQQVEKTYGKASSGIQL